MNESELQELLGESWEVVDVRPVFSGTSPMNRGRAAWFRFRRR